LQFSLFVENLLTYLVLLSVEVAVAHRAARVLHVVFSSAVV